MDPEERRRRLLEDIDQIDEDLIPALSSKYGVSEMTIRRDLKLLEEEGRIIRTHGGAVRLPPQGNAVLLPAWERRAQKARRRKVSIARYAAQRLVADGDIIILEGGTTATAMVEHLASRQDLTIVTNGYFTTGAAMRWLGDDTTIICAGGMLQPETSTFVGPMTERFFSEFHAHRLFLSATGLTLQASATDPKMLETEVKRAMVQAASEVILLLDSSKFGARSLMTVLALHEIALLVTDWRAPDEMVQALRERGVEVAIAPE